jgi:hypothetical protein
MIRNRTSFCAAILHGAVVTAGFSACSGAFFALMLVMGYRVFGNFHEAPMPLLLCCTILGTAMFTATVLLALGCAVSLKHASFVNGVITSARPLPALAESASVSLAHAPTLSGAAHAQARPTPYATV